jgi:hypothetical protein
MCDSYALIGVFVFMLLALQPNTALVVVILFAACSFPTHIRVHQDCEVGVTTGEALKSSQQARHRRCIAISTPQSSMCTQSLVDDGVSITCIVIPAKAGRL